MLRIHHPHYLPVAPRDNHPAAGRCDAHPGLCLDQLALSDGWGPFTCTRGSGHAGHHVACIDIVDLSGHMHVRPAHPVTPDAVAVIAEWDNHRATDGRTN